MNAIDLSCNKEFPEEIFDRFQIGILPQIVELARCILLCKDSLGQRLDGNGIDQQTGQPMRCEVKTADLLVLPLPPAALYSIL